MMGSNNGSSDQKPIHKVTLTDYYIGETEVTNAQYAAFLNEYGSDEVKYGEHKGKKMARENEWGLKNVNKKWKLLPKGFRLSNNDDKNWISQVGYDNYPIIDVSWYGANEFCKYYGGFLPSEAQWEYAARGGKKSNNYKYSGSNNPDEVAWYGRNSNSITHEVKTKKANELGLYDMTGNVQEWCQDYYDAEYYNKNINSINPINKVNDTMSFRSLRGGAWISSDSLYLDVSHRCSDFPFTLFSYYGFRICLPSI